MMTSQNIDLCLSCRSLPVESFVGVRIAVLSFLEGSTGFIELCQTETVVGNISPSFSKTASVVFQFERPHLIRFVVYRIDGKSEIITGIIATVECSLGEVLSRGGNIELPLFPQNGPSAGVLRLETRISKYANEALRLQFCGHSFHSPHDGHPLSTYFMVFLPSEESHLLLLYKSEPLPDKNPVWRSFLIPNSQSISQSSSIEIAVYNNNVNAPDTFIGKFSTSFDRLLRGCGAINTYKVPTASGSNVIWKKEDNPSLELMNIIQVTTSSFVDFIKAGTQIHFSVAVDFTASNGNPLDPSSLHYIHPHSPNCYMVALRSVSNVIAKYNRHGKIAAFGFGAQTPPDYNVSHLFFLNGGKDPHVLGVDGLLAAYRSALFSIRPYAPTDFSEVIYHVYTFGAAANRLGGAEHYFVLLIVTDGCVNEPRKTLDAIVECSYLPMSIVIVGVGKRDYSPMQQLLSCSLKSSNGKALQRDIVTFVHFDEHMQEKDLVSQLLANIPRQFLCWANLNGRYPGQQGKT